jgi:hypothetical protein
MYGKIERKELYAFLNYKPNQETAKCYFSTHQPHIWSTGWYSAPSWNWAYNVGITHVDGQYFEVVTAFGQVEAARKISLDSYGHTTLENETESDKIEYKHEQNDIREIEEI